MAQFKYLGGPLDRMYNYCPAERQNVKRSRRVCGGIGQDCVKRSGGYQIGRDVLFVSGLGGANVWLVFLVPVGRNGENFGRVTHWFPMPNHGEAGTDDYMRYEGDTGRKVSSVSCGYAVGGHLH